MTTSTELSYEDKLDASKYLNLLKSSSSSAVFKAKNPDYLNSNLYKVKRSNPILSNLSDEDYLTEVAGSDKVSNPSGETESDVRLNNLTSEAKDLEVEVDSNKFSVNKLMEDLNKYVSKSISAFDGFMMMLYGLVLVAEQAFRLMPNFLSELGTSLFGDGVSIEDKNENANAETEQKSTNDTSVVFDTTSEKYGEFRYYQEREIKTLTNKKNIFELNENDINELKDQGIPLTWYDEYMNDLLDKPFMPFYKGSAEYISKDFLSKYLTKDQVDIVTSKILTSEDLIGTSPFENSPLTKSAVNELATYEAKLYLGDKYRSVNLDKEKFIDARYVDSTGKSVSNPIDSSALDKEYKIIAMSVGDDLVYTQYRMNKGELQSRVSSSQDEISNLDWENVSSTGEVDADHIAEAMSSLSDASDREVVDGSDFRMMSSTTVNQNFNINKISARIKSYVNS